jgi:hypothetical protein
MHKLSDPLRILKGRIQLLAKEARLALAIAQRLRNAVPFEAEFRILVTPPRTPDR